MSFRDKSNIQRAIFIIAIVILVAGLMWLYNAVFKDANFKAGIESPENNDIVLPENTIDQIAEPNYSYNVTTINIAGTCTPSSMLGSNSYGTFNNLLNENGSTYFLRELTDIFRNDDLTIAACDTVFSDNAQLKKVDKDKLEWYKGPAKNAEVFSSGCIDALVLECTRAGDYGTAGYADTKAALEAYGLLWSDSGKAIYKEFNGIKVALYCGKLSEANALSMISWTENAAKNNDFVILYVTDKEEGHLPSNSKKSIFRSFIDAGADVVVGTNGTSLQPAEFYNDGFIIYSLGSLIDGSMKYTDRYTAILQINIKSYNGEVVNTSFEVVPCITYASERPWQPAVLSEYDELLRVNAFMRGERDTPHG